MTMRAFHRALILSAALILVWGLVTPVAEVRAEGLATIMGVVSDPDGRPIEGVRLTLSGVGVGRITTLSGANGGYRFPALRPLTTYTISAQYPGHRTVEYEGMRLARNRTRRIDFRLRGIGDHEAVVLLTRDPFPHQELVSAFVGALDIPVRFVDLDAEPDPAEAVRRVRGERPNLILSTGLEAALLIRSEVEDIPSILTLVTEPRQHDFDAPNLCFVSHHPAAADIVDRLSSFLPDARHIGLVYESRASSMFARELRIEAERRGLEVTLCPVYNSAVLSKKLDKLPADIDLLVVPRDAVTASPEAIDTLTRWSLLNRVPLAVPDPEWVRRGALFSYGAFLERIGLAAAQIAAKILNESIEPEDVETHIPDAHILAVNRGTAQALGLEIPAGLDIDITY